MAFPYPSLASVMAAVVTPTSTGISSPSDSLIIASPTLSASVSSLSSSGFDFVAVRQHLPINTVPPKTPHTTAINAGEEPLFSDDDELVWNVSESEDFSEGIHGSAVLSDDDFVVLSRARSPTKAKMTLASGSAASQTDTIRGLPPNIRLGTDSGSEPKVNKDVAASEFAKELDKLSTNAEPTKETSETKMLVKTETSIAGALKKAKKAGKERTEEEKQKRKERKEKKKQERAAAKALRKEETAAARELKKGKAVIEKETEKEKERESGNKDSVDIAAMHMTEETSMPPIVAPVLAKSVSTATLVPSSNTDSTSVPSGSPSALYAIGSREERESLGPAAPTPPSEVHHLHSSLSSETLKTPTIVQKPLGAAKKIKKQKKDKTSASALTSPASAPATKIPASIATNTDDEDKDLSTQHNTVTAEKVSEQTYSQESPTPYDEAVSYITSCVGPVE